MNDRKGREDGGPVDSPPDADAALSQRLRDLDRRLDRSRAGKGETTAKKSPSNQTSYGLAVRLGADFIAGVILGVALGWGFDRFFGTSPWGLAVGLLFGFAAGLLSMLRSAGMVRPGDGDLPH